MSGEHQDLLIPASISSAPSVLIAADFVAQVATMEAAVACVIIRDAEDAAEGARLLALSTRFGGDLEKARTALLRPYLDTQKQINAAAQAVAARLENAKTVIKGKLNIYQDMQRKLAEEAERKRKAAADEAERVRVAELKRLEDLAAAEKAEADKKAAELLAKYSGVPTIGLESVDDEEPPPAPVKSETELAIEKLKYAPPAMPAAPIVAPKIAGVTFRETLEIAGTTIADLPESFVVMTANLMLLRQTYCTGWKAGDPLPVCPGCVFRVNRQPITR